MSQSGTAGVCQILKLLERAQLGSGNSVYDHVKGWVGQPTSDAAVARVLIYVLDMVNAAEVEISSSAASADIQGGLLEVTSGLKVAFSINGMNAPLGSYVPALKSAISMFSMMSGFVGQQHAEQPKEIDDLINKVEETIVFFRGSGVEPPVIEAAIRHLIVLSTMLRNIEAFGIDGAMATYMELVVRLKRISKRASPETSETVAGIWGEIESWAGRLQKIDEIWSTGQNLLSKADGMLKIVGF